MKIKVLSKKVITTDAKGKENVFYRYFTPVNIQVIKKYENGKDEDLGIQEKSLAVHFRKVALKKLDDERVFAIIGSEKGENIQLPFVYIINVHEDGSIDYPDSNDVWVRDFDSYEEIPFTPRKSTCVPIVDEEETEPIEITEEN